jgi:hypothetical protein
MKALFFVLMLLGAIGSRLYAHDHRTSFHNDVSVHNRTIVHNDVSVHVGVGGGWGHGWYHDRVYYTDPWYHSSHVYIYQGDPYAVYYYGYPYYYFDPRFYYFE